MKTNTPIVHCIYAPDGEPLSALLEKAFRLYLVRILAAPGHGTE